MRLTDHVWLVGSGGAGFSITHPRDCHVYLIMSGGDAVLIDSGAGIETEPILAEIERAGAGALVSRIVITHAHADHSGGAAELGRVLGATVYASAEVAGYLREGDAEKASFDVMQGPGGYPDDYRFRSCAVDGELTDGERLAVGELELEVLSTPGHSSGHLAFLLHRPGGTDLFSGDAAFAQGRILLQDLWDCSVRESTRTIRRLAALKPDGLYPGHGLFAVRDGWHHLYSAMEEIQSGLPPRQLTF
ncbi:MBL fold metallo-hydrolase [Microlunatus speluncae]|uniref:MBL fold metallo-hydrolase n=1 Tax=Microlunatus speluncae TaxID=2594267 RepID=UPI001266131F|nr:MBL fold metallo-hydrolase [Microlunatus speluncae]